jgi:hypothetical protein
MSDAMGTLGEALERYRDAFPYPSGACGVVAAVCGRFVAMDAFDSPSTLEAIWGRLVASYAIDAEAASDDRETLFSSKAIEVILAHVAEQQAQAFPAVGAGQELRFETASLLGQCLSAENRLVHLSVFPPPRPSTSRISERLRMRPPSERM